VGNIKGEGVYITSQLNTAEYYANLAGGGGRGLGPAIVGIEIPADEWGAFVDDYGIEVETPIDRGPFAGATETLIPFDAVPNLDGMARYYILEEAGDA